MFSCFLLLVRFFIFFYLFRKEVTITYSINMKQFDLNNRSLSLALSLSTLCSLNAAILRAINYFSCGVFLLYSFFFFHVSANEGEGEMRI